MRPPLPRTPQQSVTLTSQKVAHLVEVGELGDLVPEVAHDLGVGGVGGVLELAAPLDEGGAEGEAHEVILVQVAVVVDVWSTVRHTIHQMSRT